MCKPQAFEGTASRIQDDPVVDRLALESIRRHTFVDGRCWENATYVFRLEVRISLYSIGVSLVAEVLRVYRIVSSGPPFVSLQP